MGQKIEIKKLIERMEKLDNNDSFSLAAEVAILKNKDLLEELAK